jgi:hypothetical protein
VAAIHALRLRSIAVVTDLGLARRTLPRHRRWILGGTNGSRQDACNSRDGDRHCRGGAGLRQPRCRGDSCSWADASGATVSLPVSSSSANSRRPTLHRDTRFASGRFPSRRICVSHAGHFHGIRHSPVGAVWWGVDTRKCRMSDTRSDPSGQFRAGRCR